MGALATSYCVGRDREVAATPTVLLNDGIHTYTYTPPLHPGPLRSLPAFIKFVAVSPDLHLDGFVFALPGAEFGRDVHRFGRGVCRVLRVISDADPYGFHCMRKSYISKIGWLFEFAGAPIFVTTFAPCYPENHSRYSFGSESCFILLQPMTSFAIHSVGEDTPTTNWDNPHTPRDKIRVAYRDNGRPYNIRSTVMYPQAHDVVKPLRDEEGVVCWWAELAEVKGADDEAMEHFLGVGEETQAVPSAQEDQ